MIECTLSKKISSLAQQYPVVTVTGPRQSGKTTFTKMVFMNHDYVGGDDLYHRENFSVIPWFQVTS